MTNDEHLKELASRGDGSLQAWFDAEHVDARFHGATRMTNLERLFVDSEQFRQAVSAFAFVHSDDCPTSPTQMVDWLMAPYVDAQSKDQSKDAPTLSDLYGILSDANDDLAPESDVTEDAVDAQRDNNGTSPNGDETASNDCGHSTDMSRKKPICVREGGEIASSKPDSKSVARKTAKTAENATTKCDIRDFDDSREKLEADVREYYRIGLPGIQETELHRLYYEQVIEWLNRQAAITRKTEQAAWIQQANGLIHEANVERDELRDELAKRDKGIVRLKRQRDEARDFLTSSENLNADLRAMNDALADDNDRLEAECYKLQNIVDNLRAECNDCVYKQEFKTMDRLEAERDALAHDLQDCEQQRERLRQALGTAIDHAHEVVSLVNLDGEVIG